MVPCAEKYRLLDQLKSLVRQYSSSIQAMTAAVGTAEFDLTLKQCQKIRAAMLKAKEELNDHSVEHRC